MDDLGLRDRDEIIVNDRFATVIWALMLIWMGTAILAGFQHWAADWRLPDLVWFPMLRSWLADYEFDFRVVPLLFLGNAAILTLELLLRIIVKRLRHNLTMLFLYIFAFLGLAAGSCGMFEPVMLVPGFFVAWGVAILLSTILQKQTN
jgi:hypothetical protein